VSAPKFVRPCNALQRAPKLFQGHEAPVVWLAIFRPQARAYQY
jgi:hypothetical protein